MKHVMVSDNDHGIFENVRKALQDNYQISPLPKDTGLIEYLRSNHADGFILMAAAGGSGCFRTFDIIRRIPEMSAKPVIFLGGQKDPEAEQRVLSLGEADYIPLPVSPVLLIHRVAACLELAELRNEKPYVEKYQDAISKSFAELVECRDTTTGGHLKNTTRYFSILLEEAIADDYYKDMIPVEDARDLLRSVTLHDIGKIGINDEILRKASPLDYNEYEYMKTHTTLGMQAFDRIIRETGGSRWLYLAKDLAYCHHERWDGTGYPNGLKGEKIPLYARMLTIADVYDALTSNRAYKEAFSHQQAMGIIMEGRGSLFDPRLVDLFVKANERFQDILLRKNREAESIERK